MIVRVGRGAAERAGGGSPIPRPRRTPRARRARAPGGPPAPTWAARPRTTRGVRRCRAACAVHGDGRTRAGQVRCTSHSGQAGPREGGTTGEDCTQPLQRLAASPEVIRHKERRIEPAPRRAPRPGPSSGRNGSCSPDGVPGISWRGQGQRGAHRVGVRAAFATARGDSRGAKRLGGALRREPEKVARSTQHFLNVWWEDFAGILKWNRSTWVT